MQTIADNLFSDYAFIQGEDYHDFEYVFHNGGGNICDRDGSGPDEAGECKVESVELEPPPPIGGLE